MKRTTTLGQALHAIYDIECTERWSDYLVPPIELPAEERVRTFGSAGRFGEPYIDTYDKRFPPLPDFMVLQLRQLAAALMDFAYLVSPNPHVSFNSYVPMRDRLDSLRAHGYQIFNAGYMKQLDGEIMAARLSHGVFWFPFGWAAEQRLIDSLYASLHRPGAVTA